MADNYEGEDRRRRQRTDSDDLVHAVVCAIREEAAGPFKVPPETHFKHHEYIDALLAREKVRAERREKLRTQLIGWAAVTGLGGVVAGLGWVGRHAADLLKLLGGPKP